MNTEITTFSNISTNEEFEEKLDVEDVEDVEDIEFEGEETLKPSSNNDEGSRVVKVDRSQYSIFELVRNINKGRIVVDPDFQRSDVWKYKQKCELVESVFMGIPLPLIYLAERKDGKIIVVDGRQRLTAFKEFFGNKWTLRYLTVLKEFNNRKFDDLDDNSKSSFEDFQIVAHIIKPPTPDRLKFEIFDRVNRKGTQLNNQEMRNALYQGNATKILKELSQNNDFKNATDNSIKSTRMKDTYIILRFISFYCLRKKYLRDDENQLIEYKSDIDDFLGKVMDFLNNSDNDFNNLIKAVFFSASKLCIENLDRNGFRLPPSETGRKRPINMLLFESVMYLASLCIEKGKTDKFSSLYSQLLCNDEFLGTLNTATDSRYVIDKRLSYVERVVSGG